MKNPFIAVDWGTTNRRAYVIDNGQVIRTERDDLGAARVQNFPAEVELLRKRLGDLPMIMAGMVGSNIGWVATPYVSAPAGLEALADNLVFMDRRTAVVPGLSLALGNSGGHVMRGEEVQFLGAVAAGLVAPEALLCQPGTHSKWAIMQDGHVSRFVTAMTGELFALLRMHSLLSSQLTNDARHEPAFCEGVTEGARRDLAASLFSVRADALLGRRAPEHAMSFVSGILIGAEVAARMKEFTDRSFAVLADPHMGGLYVTAARMLGGDARIVDGHAAYVAGITEIWSRIS